MDTVASRAGRWPLALTFAALAVIAARSGEPVASRGAAAWSLQPPQPNVSPRTRVLGLDAAPAEPIRRLLHELASRRASQY
jgi:hypothetical protein